MHAKRTDNGFKMRIFISIYFVEYSKKNIVCLYNA